MDDKEPLNPPAGDRSPAPNPADVQLDRRGDFAVLIMSNPGRRNCFSPQSRAKLQAFLEDLAVDADIKAIILTGADGHFCSGADVAGLRTRQQARRPLDIRQGSKRTLGLLRAIAGNPKPIIAAVEGDAFGGGMAFAAASDVVIATRTARFGAGFTTLGILPDLGLLYTLQQRVGASRARLMLMTSARISGEKAHEIGLADELVEPGKALEAAMVWVEKFSAVGPIAVALTKESIAAGINSIDDVSQIEANFAPFLISTEDAKEGMAAFVGKRWPQFRGF